MRQAVKTAMGGIEFCNHRRYHEGMDNVTLADIYYDRQEEILKRKEEENMPSWTSGSSTIWARHGITHCVN